MEKNFPLVYGGVYLYNLGTKTIILHSAPCDENCLLFWFKFYIAFNYRPQLLTIFGKKCRPIDDI